MSSPNSALIPYLDSTFSIVMNMQKVIDPHLVSIYPRNFAEAFVAMSNPFHTNFKHMTPSYLYLFILGYLIFRYRNRKLSREDMTLICLGIYGFIMYNTGFRGIWAAQFEMALQPEKILLFFLLEVIMVRALTKREAIIEAQKVVTSAQWHNRDNWKLYAVNAFMFILIGSSVGYPIQRYNHRFFAFKYTRDKLM